MLITLRYENERRIEGLVLAMNEDTMRVAIPGLKETQEFRCVEGLWFGEKGESVDFESIVLPAFEEAPLKVNHA